MRLLALAAVALAALCLGAGAAAGLGGSPLATREAASMAPAALLQAAETLALPAPPAGAPTVVVQAFAGAPVVAKVVQPLLARPEPVTAPPADAPLLLPEDLAAIEAAVVPAPHAAPLPPPETYLFPRDEPVPLLAAPLPLVAPARALEAAAAPPAPAAQPDALASLAPAAAAGTAALLLAAGLYVRLAPAEALASPTRRRAYDAVRADPGCTVNTVARAIGVDYKTAQHHLRVLRRSGFLQAERVGGWERYFVTGDLPNDGHAAAVVLRAPAARALATALAERGAARAADLARALGVSEATASVQLRRLAAAGVARRGADGRWVTA